MPETTNELVVLEVGDPDDTLVVALRPPSDVVLDPRADARTLSNLAASWCARAVAANEPGGLEYADQLSAHALEKASRRGGPLVRAAVRINRATVLMAMERDGEAAVQAKKVLDDCKKIATSVPERERLVADALTVLVQSQLSDPPRDLLGQVDELIAASRGLARRDPSFSDRLAATLLTSSIVLSRFGQNRRALEVASEAVDIRRSPADGSQSGGAGLAVALSGLACRHAEVDEPIEAASRWIEASEIYSSLGDLFGEHVNTCVKNTRVVSAALSPWAAVDRVRDRHDPMLALSAAKDDVIRHHFRAVGGGKSTLSLTCAVDGDGRRLQVNVGNENGIPLQVSLPQAVIAKAAELGMAPMSLVASALHSATPQEHDWTLRRVGNSSRPEGAAVDRMMQAYRHTSADDEIVQALGDGHDVVLMGDYGSGKTATATAHARRCMDEEGHGVVWLDLTDTADGPESLLAAMLAMPRHDRYLVFVDSVQANPAAFEGVQRWVHKLRNGFGHRIQILATAWPRLVKAWREPFKDFRKVTARSDELILGILRDSWVPAGAHTRIIELAGHDVHLAVEATEFYRHRFRVPTWRDLTGEHTAWIPGDEAREAVYWFACLGFFGLDASHESARTRLASWAVDLMVRKGLIADSDGRYSIPSHAWARLALAGALGRWSTFARWGRPEQVAWEHMQRSGEQVIRATLGRLDLVGVSGHARRPYAARAWELFTQLADGLARRCGEDPSWGDNMGAAISAAKALAVAGNDSAWHQVAEYIRARWDYGVEPELPRPKGAASAEAGDFDKIITAMRREDEVSPAAPGVIVGSAESVDMPRFYRTWMLGALLEFEGTAMTTDRRRLDGLRVAAAAEIGLWGFFEPRREPWVTAWIIIGLCEAGENYHSNDVVRRACDWLRRPIRNGGPFEGMWRSGTGSWNTPEATTAMCITALLRAGAPAEAEVEAGLAWLQWRDSEWIQPGREVDLALVLEAMLLGDDAGKVHKRVLGLLVWERDVLTRTTTEAGLRTPFVAAQSASFLRAMVVREYRALMRALLPGVDDDSSFEPSDHGPGRAELGPETDRIRGIFEAFRESRRSHTREASAADLAQELTLLQSRLRRSRALAVGAGHETREALLREVDRMGREIYGSAWVDLDLPDDQV